MPQKIKEIKNYTSSEIKELVVSGDPVQIQAALDNNKLKRKRNKVFEVDHDNKRIVFVATTDTVDRDGERVMPTSFENNMHYYLENPVVLYGHNHNEPAVGRMVGHVVMKDKVTMEVEYAVGIGHQLADLLWELYSADTPFMRMVSIGFIPLKWSDNESEKLEGQSGVTYSEIEPIELSLVNIGSNRYALSDLPMKIRNDSVMKSTYEQLVEGNTAIGVSEKEVAETTQETITMATEDKDKLEPEKETSESQETAAYKAKQSQEHLISTLKSLDEGDLDKITKVLNVLDRNDTIVETTPATNSLPAGNILLTADDIEVAKADTEAKLMEAKARTAKAEAEIAESRAKVRNLRLEVKGDSLSDYLNEQIGDGDDRTDLIAQVSDESDRSLATINGILDGTIDCPDNEVIEAFSEVLGIGEDVILQYADMDECEYDDETDDEDDTEDDEMHDDDDEMSAKDDDETETETETDAVEVDDEDDEIDNIVMNEAGIAELIQKANDGNIKAVRKFYGISGMFEGSFEEIKSLISDKISGYLEYELDLKDEFWIDYEVLCTKLTEVLIYSFQKKQVYKIDYVVDGKDVEFTAIEAVKLTYEMMESMDDEEKAVILENDELPTPELELSHLTDEEHTTEEQLAD